MGSLACLGHRGKGKLKEKKLGSTVTRRTLKLRTMPSKLSYCPVQHVVGITVGALLHIFSIGRSKIFSHKTKVAL